MGYLRKCCRAAVFVGGLGAASLLAAGPATAAAQTFSERSTENVTGDVFTCTSGDLTITSGSITIFVHGTIDNNGIVHFTGTIVPHGITLTDTNGNTYTLSGAAWFGGSGPDPDTGDVTVATDTDHFVIHSSDGGVFAKVQMVDHLSPNGSTFTFDRGSCQAPED